MELNWTTFSLEVINFLILAWILAHFFYRPVMRVIAERQARIQASLDEADQRHHEAEALKAEYEGRLTESEQERETARAALRRDIDEERAKALEELRQEMEEAREKGRVIEERRLDDTRRRVEQAALMQGASFTARLLTRLANPELETRLIELFLQDLDELPEARIATLRHRGEGDHTERRATIETAYPLAAKQRAVLVERLGALLDGAVDCRFVKRPELIAGLRVTVGPWVLHANLHDELAAFAEYGHAAT